MVKHTETSGCQPTEYNRRNPPAHPVVTSSDIWLGVGGRNYDVLPKNDYTSYESYVLSRAYLLRRDKIYWIYNRQKILSHFVHHHWNLSTDTHLNNTTQMKKKDASSICLHNFRWKKILINPQVIITMIMIALMMKQICTALP